MPDAPTIEIDLESFWNDPYPTFERLRAEAPIAFVPQLGGIVFTRKDDIATCEKNIEVFSSHQPQGPMNRLMGLNLMRKDGEAHRSERMAMLPAVSPQTVKTYWRETFERNTTSVLRDLAPRGAAEFCTEYAMPVSAEALKSLTGLTNLSAHDMDACSQAMIDGISNFAGVPEIEARCNAATAQLDAAMDARLPELDDDPAPSLLKVFVASGMAMDSVRANVKLAISGGQNEPRDAIAGTVWALLKHPEQHALIRAGQYSYIDAFEEYVRWISPIGMSPRRVAQPHEYNGVSFNPEDRVFFLFSSANRDEQHFEAPAKFDLTRNRQRERHIAFGAGPHFCAGAAASRALIAEVAVPAAFDVLDGLELSAPDEVTFGGWAFRGPLHMPVRWSPGDRATC